MRRFLMLFTVGVATYASPLAGQTWSPEQQEIWKVEEQQWGMAASKDLTWIESMVHPNASVWGNDWPGPQNKASLSRWAKYSSANFTVLEQELFPISLTITGNIAVAHYRYRLAGENYKEGT